jgi:hypothetical protein
LATFFPPTRANNTNSANVPPVSALSHREPIVGYLPRTAKQAQVVPRATSTADP